MKFLEQLQSRKGGLVQLKTELYWYDQKRYDGNPERVCLILDAAVVVDVIATTATDVAPGTAAYLLIDGVPQWIWIAEADVELL